MKWHGSIVAITGASRGIGAAVARAAAAKGARVALLARAKDELEAVLEKCGGNGIVVECDVSDRASVERAFHEVARALGPVEILVNNAGIGDYARFADADVRVLERMMQVNYMGTVYATKAVLPGMLARGRGHVVNLASIAGRMGAPVEAGYSATKFAMAGLTEALYFECAPRGVRVSMIHPGPVKTSFFDARGVPYQRTIPRPVSAERVARAVIKAVERNRAEQFVPRWLRFPPFLKAALPPVYRFGTGRSFRKALR